MVDILLNGGDVELEKTPNVKKNVQREKEREGERERERERERVFCNAMNDFVF